jgi:hypothetical protein
MHTEIGIMRVLNGRGRRTRTLGTWFWRPLLYQLSYTPIFLRTLCYYIALRVSCQATAMKIRRTFFIESVGECAR